MAIVGFIVKGDRTSHGGQVVECTSRRSIDGLLVARVGDLVRRQSVASSFTA